MTLKKLIKCYVYEFLGHPGLHHTREDWLAAKIFREELVYV